MLPHAATHNEDEAQRSLERRALRNVRTLVDKLETDEQKRARITLRFVVTSVIVALIAAVMLYMAMTGQAKQQPPVISRPAGAATSVR